MSTTLDAALALNAAGYGNGTHMFITTDDVDVDIAAMAAAWGRAA